MDGPLPPESIHVAQEPQDPKGLADAGPTGEHLRGMGIDAVGVVQRQDEGVEVGAPDGLPDPLPGAGSETLVGVQGQDPIAGAPGERHVARLGEVVLPGVVHHVQSWRYGSGVSPTGRPQQGVFQPGPLDRGAVLRCGLPARRSQPGAQGGIPEHAAVGVGL